MSDDGNHGSDNPGSISVELCEAYRETIHTEITAIKNQIIGALGISTAIITLVMYLLKLQ